MLLLSKFQHNYDSLLFFPQVSRELKVQIIIEIRIKSRFDLLKEEKSENHRRKIYKLHIDLLEIFEIILNVFIYFSNHFPKNILSREVSLKTLQGFVINIHHMQSSHLCLK